MSSTGASGAALEEPVVELTELVVLALVDDAALPPEPPSPLESSPQAGALTAMLATQTQTRQVFIQLPTASYVRGAARRPRQDIAVRVTVAVTRAVEAPRSGPQRSHASPTGLK